ncbi:protein TIFY 4B isoform X2 [Cannabis sativa]|uniref:protein TIFY 4B isoform X2 n=1 Tax=Cannabis sativa TaxID=3483 RepID=UPI0029CA0EFB|nr:protein TIFY 4B isoform X2 [Cannabis sativa]
MSAGTTTFRSILEKPLNQLTEDDISQLTREDCRKYLKDKGMRRPSWNKSQAIQQVISLKALLEPCDDSGAEDLRKVIASPTSNTPRLPTFSVTSSSADSAKEASADVQVSVSAEESVPGPRKEPTKSVPEPEERPADIDERESARSQCATDASAGQMTIFYCGKVNVYEGVQPEKARAIMQLAASPIPLSRENSFGVPAAVRPFPLHLNSTSEKCGVPPSVSISQPTQADADGQASRQVSLQRYREKRKDRLKSKRNTASNSSSLEVYLNHQVKTHMSNGNSSRSSTSSPTQPGFPQALCSTMDNQSKITCLPVDLNENRKLKKIFPLFANYLGTSRLST